MDREDRFARYRKALLKKLLAENVRYSEKRFNSRFSDDRLMRALDADPEFLDNEEKLLGLA